MKTMASQSVAARSVSAMFLFIKKSARESIFDDAPLLLGTSTVYTDSKLYSFSFFYFLLLPHRTRVNNSLSLLLLLNFYSASNQHVIILI